MKYTISICAQAIYIYFFLLRWVWPNTEILVRFIQPQILYRLQGIENNIYYSNDSKTRYSNDSKARFIRVP